MHGGTLLACICVIAEEGQKSMARTQPSGQCMSGVESRKVINLGGQGERDRRIRDLTREGKDFARWSRSNEDRKSVDALVDSTVWSVSDDRLSKFCPIHCALPKGELWGGSGTLRAHQRSHRGHIYPCSRPCGVVTKVCPCFLIGPGSQSSTRGIGAPAKLAPCCVGQLPQSC